VNSLIPEPIRIAIQRYFDGHATGDPSIMRQAFHESARLQFVKEGRYAEWSLDEYLARLPGRAADDESRRTRRITAVQATDEAATAELELDYPTVQFVDYLTLLLINGEWVIVNKAFKALPKDVALRPTAAGDR
jgi:hypothetical protein